MIPHLFADANDDGIRFILQSPDKDHTNGGLLRDREQGHLVTMAGRGGTGKSVLALQFLTELLNQSEGKSPAAFYFTLEASPLELARQLRDFEFGQRYFPHPELTREESEGSPPLRDLTHDSLYWSCGGLHLHAIPSPVEDLAVLIRQIRQTIANILVENLFDDLVGIVIDPLGGIRSRDTLRTDLSSLKHLADSHKTFLFLLAEDHIYEQHKSIEHYSQTVLQLQHDPFKQPTRGIFVQKARSQPFRAGYHQLDLRKSGVTVFPSVEAQSAYAHDLKRSPDTAKDLEKAAFLTINGFDQLREIEDGSVIFLMGPPGTFKQYIACNFATAPENASSLYISFKAEQSAVEKYIKPVEDYHTFVNSGERSEPATCFIDVRNPLSTPQEILSRIRTLMSSPLRRPRIRRAVVWGLRRLADMPNFSGNIAVQFLEALVTLLQAKQTTCLLVDWPDIEKGNTLPIVDLSQYILLTRLCHSRRHLNEEHKSLADIVWKDSDNSEPRHAALLRVQRDNEGFHRDVGFRFVKSSKPNPGSERIKSDFEACWNIVGDKWEKDPSLS